MGWKNFFGLDEVAEQILPVASTITLAVEPKQLQHVDKVYKHSRVWECGCGARLKITAKNARRDGESNFIAHPTNHPVVRMRGASLLPSEHLTWNGMAEERGWKTAPTVCPACQRGLSVAEYKALKRRGKI